MAAHFLEKQNRAYLWQTLARSGGSWFWPAWTPPCRRSTRTWPGRHWMVARGSCSPAGRFCREGSCLETEGGSSLKWCLCKDSTSHLSVVLSSLQLMKRWLNDVQWENLLPQFVTSRHKSTHQKFLSNILQPAWWLLNNLQVRES